MLYFILKVYVRAGLNIYFKKYQLRGSENVPSGPVIFVANHQNAFMDALVIACATNRNPFYLARASIFKAKWAVPILTALKIIPIYRIRDGYSSLRKNDEVFSKCRSLLQKGGSLLIFPEGNHHGSFRLRTFQKGAARIALETEWSRAAGLGLKIVPVGIQYDEFDKVGNSVLVSFSKPISVSDFQESYRNDPKGCIKDLTGKLYQSISKLMINIPDDHHNLIEEKWRKIRSRNNDLTARLDEDRLLIQKIIGGDITGRDIKRKIPGKSGFPYFLLKILMKINLFLPYLLIARFIRRNLKEPMFEGSMRFGLWIFIGPVFLLIQTLILLTLTAQVQVAIVYLSLSILLLVLLTKNT